MWGLPQTTARRGPTCSVPSLAAESPGKKTWTPIRGSHAALPGGLSRAQTGRFVRAEPYRLGRRANSLRGYAHGTTESVFPRSSRAGCEDGARAWSGASIPVGGDSSDRLQARLHGHTLVGEARYIYGPDILRPVDFARQALHAFRLGFRHPTTGKPMSFEAPLPADMLELIGRLRGPGPGRRA